MKPLEQCFSTFFDSRHPSFVLEQFGGTPSFNLPVNRHQVHKLVAPLVLFTAPKGSLAPRLRTTGLDFRLAFKFYTKQKSHFLFRNADIRSIIPTQHADLISKQNCLAWKLLVWNENYLFEKSEINKQRLNKQRFNKRLVSSVCWTFLVLKSVTFKMI